MTEGLDISILGPAFVAGLLVLATHVPLGTEVLRRGIVFIDLAIAQIATLGVIAAHMAGAAEASWQIQVAALAFAAGGAGLLALMERWLPEIQEALIGSIFVLAASLAILLLANDPHGGEELRDLLVGQILWVGKDQLALMGAATGLLLLAWFTGVLRIRGRGFYVGFSVAVTLSVQLVGVYLVFASLILPALAVRKLSARPQLMLGYGLGAVGYLAGLVVSAVLDLPSGAVIVWTLAAAGLLVGTVAARVESPTRGE